MHFPKEVVYRFCVRIFILIYFILHLQLTFKNKLHVYFERTLISLKEQSNKKKREIFYFKNQKTFFDINNVLKELNYEIKYSNCCINIENGCLLKVEKLGHFGKNIVVTDKPRHFTQ